jgi:ribosomal protein L12E/L44/L45/RPP1/RPP2
MSLIDDLRRIEHFPPSHLPSISEVLNVVGVLVAYVEHGDQLLKAVDSDSEARQAGEPAGAVDELLSPTEQDPQAAPAPPAAPLGAASPTPAADDRDARIAELKRELAADEPDPRDSEIAALEQQLATRRANENRTQTSVTPDDPTPALTSPLGPPPPPPPAGERGRGI